ncbi:MAG: TetR family transcriptional regulator [Polaromonas sp.]|nr:TetR family transcriptional regulator [Polaromonas sp.]
MSDSRRALVLDAACPVFEPLGIEGVRSRKIAMQAGHTLGAIYSCFDNKEAIYEALLAESLARRDAEDALLGNTSLFAYGAGLLLWHTGRSAVRRLLGQAGRVPAARCRTRLILKNFQE